MRIIIMVPLPGIILWFNAFGTVLIKCYFKDKGREEMKLDLRKD